MKLTVERKRWLRGEGGPTSSLFRPKDQRMCCLGFMCTQLGYTEQEISDMTMPYCVHDLSKMPPWMTAVCDGPNLPSTVYSLATTNDDPEISGELREQKLAELFKKVDVEVEFDEAPLEDSDSNSSGGIGGVLFRR